MENPESEGTLDVSFCGAAILGEKVVKTEMEA
jgi:hypothetical protein